MSSAPQATIWLIVGNNGSGKTSIFGSSETYNPDQRAFELRNENPDFSVPIANSIAWNSGVEGLRYAIDHNLSFALETTLSSATITSEVRRAGLAGRRVVVSYVGVGDVEVNIRRVRARVARGIGTAHDIPEAAIRRRHVQGFENTMTIMEYVTDFHLYDNSVEVEIHAGQPPQLVRLLTVTDKTIIEVADSIPDWSAPLVNQARKLFPMNDRGEVPPQTPS